MVTAKGASRPEETAVQGEDASLSLIIVLISACVNEEDSRDRELGGKGEQEQGSWNSRNNRSKRSSSQVAVASCRPWVSRSRGSRRVPAVVRTEGAPPLQKSRGMSGRGWRDEVASGPLGRVGFGSFEGEGVALRCVALRGVVLFCAGLRGVGVYL